MAIQLFIDTNVYLKFYHFSNDDLEELNKLQVLLDNDKLELYLPEQVSNEFYRNRDNKLADALKTFTGTKLESQFPQFCKEYEEYERLKKIIRDFNHEKQQLLKNVMSAIEDNSLKADQTITALFSKAKLITTSIELIEKARIRFDLGNPPGKNKSYGDAINWEALLNAVESESDLYFIADDKDYFSEVANANFNSFLLNEWHNKKGTQIKFYKTLTDFFKDVLPDIKLAMELEKNLLITRLESAGNFYSARNVLQKINNFDAFSSEQINQIIQSSMDNTQIFWISQDEDINEMLYELANKNKEKIDETIFHQFTNKIPRLKVKVPPPPPF